MKTSLLYAENLRLDVPGAGSGRQASPPKTVLNKVSFGVKQGGALGVIGESGSGKSTLARAMTLLMPPQSGRIVFDGKVITGLKGDALTAYRAQVQLVFQDPMSALNPRKRVGASIARPLEALGRLQGRKPEAVAAALLERVGLPANFASRYPHELSGGQRQRVNIARALSLEPQILIADEVTSGLDVSAQAHIVGLLESLRKETGLSLIFISHDLSLVRSLCDDLLILRSGEVVEFAPADQVFAQPAHEYTKALIKAIALPDPDPDWLSVS